MAQAKTRNRLAIVMASVCALAAPFTLTGCTTSHPEVEMKIAFNGKKYTLEYKLYRKIAPTTVEHFLSLVDHGYYNGVCIHDYTSGKWYTGGYTFNEGTTSVFGGLEEKDYFSIVSNYKKPLKQSAWYDAEKQEGTNTLYGEFRSNGFSVKKTTVDMQTFGSLTMYYTAKDVQAQVYTKRNDGKNVNLKEYKWNSATSLFYIYVASNSTSLSSDYCTFATLKKDSKATLRKLTGAVSGYISDLQDVDESYRFTETFDDVPSDSGDRYADDGQQSYAVPKKPIVITSVKVKKY